MPAVPVPGGPACDEPLAPGARLAHTSLRVADRGGIEDARTDR